MSRTVFAAGGKRGCIPPAGPTLFIHAMLWKLIDAEGLRAEMESKRCYKSLLSEMHACKGMHVSSQPGM
eukprot:scaffold50629_cov18-Tisochrysis_lutea.AAC.2